MNNTHRSLLLTLLLTMLVASFAGSAAAGEIAPELAAKIATLDSDEFVRVILRMDERPFVTAAMGRDAVQFVLKDAAARTQAPVLDFLQAQHGLGRVSAYNSFWLVNVAFAEVEAGLVEQLADLPGVAYVFEDVQFTAPPREATAVDPQHLVWDHVASTYAPTLWRLGFRGQGVTVAVVDTGVDITHPELEGALGGTGPFHEGYWAEFDEDGHIVPGSMPHDSSDHGTHVSGTVAGRNVNSQISMAPEVQLAHALVIPMGSGSFPQILGGLQWIVERGFDIVNGSLGANDVIPEMAEATDNLAAAGVVPVFANGNINPLDPFNFPPAAPGNTPSAIAVGAFDALGEEYSLNRGGIIEYPGYEYDEFTRIKPDISAPGVNVVSTVPGGGYAAFSGTSMASPHVAGAVALLLSAKPDLSVDVIKELLYTSTGGHEQDYGWEDIDTKNIQFGWGRLNVLRAFEQMVDMFPPEGPSAEVIGRVTAGGVGVADALVTFDGQELRRLITDANGDFGAVLPEDHYTVTVEARGYVSQSQSVAVVDTGEPFRVDFELEAAPLGQAAGTVVDQDTGIGLDAVEVAAAEGPAVTTDAAGEYVLPLIEGLHTLRFEMPGYFTHVVEDVLVLPGQAAQIDAALSFGFHTVLGEVVDAQGDPLAGVEVRVVETADRMLTEEDGRFAFDLPAGDYTLQLAAAGYASTFAPVTVTHGRVEELTVDLVAEAGALQGRVLTLGGQPIEKARVSLPELGLDTETNVAGFYELDVVTAGTWQVTVEHADYWTQTSTVEIRGGETKDYDFALRSLGGVATVFENSFDTPADQAVWQFVNYGETKEEWHFSEEQSVSAPFSAWHGDPSSGNSYPGNQDVSMLSPLIPLPEVQSPDEEEIELTFMLRASVWAPYHKLRVYVIDVAAGQEKRLVYQFNDNEELPWTQIAVPLTDFAGRSIRLEFNFVSDISPIGYYGAFVDDVAIRHYDDRFSARIEGVVTDRRGQPVEDAEISVMQVAASSAVARSSHVRTDADGRYELAVPAGRWTVRASKRPEYFDGERTVEVDLGETVPADFVLDANPPPATVTGLRAEAGDGVVYLSWDAHEDADVVGYIIEQSLEPDDYFARVTGTTETHFEVKGLQNGYTYYFRVAAVDRYGLEGEAASASATPSDTMPKVSGFDVQPRSLLRGGTLLVRAAVTHPTDEAAVFDVRLEASRGDDVVRTWSFEDTPAGAFETALEAVDAFGRPWAPNIYHMTLFATDEAGRTVRSNTVNVAVLAPLPQGLSFVLGDNPFNPAEGSQAVEYGLPSSGRVTVGVYTLDGRLVRTLVDAVKEPGQYVAFWDGADDEGRVVLGGMYVVRVQFVDGDGRQMDVARHSVVVK